MDDEVRTLALRVAALERGLESAIESGVRRDVYDAHHDAARTEGERMRTAIEEVRDTLRWQSRVLVLWALGMIVTLAVAATGMVTG